MENKSMIIRRAVKGKERVKRSWDKYTVTYSDYHDYDDSFTSIHMSELIK